MKILLATKTFNPITHGPAKFAHFMLQINERYPEHEIRLLTEGIETEVPNLIYKIKTDYQRPFGSLWPIFDNFTYYAKIEEIRTIYDFDVLLVNNAIQGIWSRMKLPASVKVAGMLNDDNYLSETFSTVRWDRMWLINRYRKIIESLAVEKLDRTITNSFYLKNKVLDVYKVPKDKVTYVYKSVDFSHIDYKSSQDISIEKTIKILFVKSDYPRGGLRVLIEALSSLVDYNFKLTIIGPKTIQKETILSYFKNKKNIQSNYLGPQSQTNVFTAFCKHHIFCVPAHKEALGVANIEALAAGIPVVSTSVGGIPEVLDHGKNGWLCKPDDIKSLAEAIKDCLTNETARTEKVRNGRAFVIANFGYENMLSNVIKILEAV